MVRLAAKDTLHRDNALRSFTERIGGLDYLAVIDIAQASGVTPTIVNVSTAGAGWTLVASGLSSIRTWRLSERGGNDFRYAFVAAPATYATGFGWISDNTPLTAIYVQRPTTTDIDCELVYWS